MAGAKPANELKALQDRVAELEKQLRELKARVVAVTATRAQLPTVPQSEDEAEALHRANQRVHKIIQKYREADRRKAAAEYDRLHGKTKRPPANRKSAKAGAPARRAG